MHVNIYLYDVGVYRCMTVSIYRVLVNVKCMYIFIQAQKLFGKK